MLAASYTLLHTVSPVVPVVSRTRHVLCLSQKGKAARMTRGVKKENLPSKICVVCNRPFTWRKVWERCWDEVQTCSDRCKGERKRQLNAINRAKREQQGGGDDAVADAEQPTLSQ